MKKLLGIVGLASILFALALALGCGRVSTSRSKVEVFDPATYTGPTATITFPHQLSGQLHLRDTRRNKIMLVRLAGGKAQMCTGTFRPVQYVVEASDRQGVRWGARTVLLGTPPIVLAANSTHELKVGPPFTAAMSIRKRGSASDVLYLRVTGVGGKTYSFTKAGRRPPAPQFEVKNESSEVVFTDKFAYG